MDNPNGIKLDVDGTGVYSTTSTIKSKRADAILGLVLRICLVWCICDIMLLLLLESAAAIDALSRDTEIVLVAALLDDDDVVDREEDCGAFAIAFSTGVLRDDEAMDSKQRNIK